MSSPSVSVFLCFCFFVSMRFVPMQKRQLNQQEAGFQTTHTHTHTHTHNDGLSSKRIRHALNRVPVDKAAAEPAQTMGIKTKMKRHAQVRAVHCRAAK